MVFNKIKSLLHIRKEEEEQNTYQEIKEGVFFRGHNLWLLVLAMCIACIGLNTNNTAAVIGAMLISPLMGPIVGLGFGFGIGSKSMVQISLYNWGIMVATSLIASSFYFLISPFDFTTDQLNSFKEGSIFAMLSLVDCNIESCCWTLLCKLSIRLRKSFNSLSALLGAKCH